MDGHNLPLENEIKKFAPPPKWEKVHLGEGVSLKLIHFSPFFCQILQIFLILDLFLPRQEMVPKVLKSGVLWTKFEVRGPRKWTSKIKYKCICDEKNAKKNS